MLFIWEEYLELNYKKYLELLKQLVAINTVFYNKRGIYKALDFCKRHFDTYLKGYTVFFDKENNLIAVNKNVNTALPVIYLSAHIDTVPATKNGWGSNYHPFRPFEDSKEIVGRGVSDCKAGVAYQLFLASLIDEHFPATTNIIFTISSREENAGESAKEIGLQIGKKLPAGTKIYLMTLENNVTVDPPSIAINHGERGSIGVEIVATLDEVRNFLLNDQNEWNPTSIKPLKKINIMDFEELRQAGRHAATSKRETNLLYQLLIDQSAHQLILEAGSKRAISTIPAFIRKSTTDTPVKHKIIFDLRTFKKIKDLVKELEIYNLKYQFVKKLDFGYDLKRKFLKMISFKK